MLVTEVRASIEPSRELDRLAHDVIGAAIEVHRVLGPGFLEAAYEEALAFELGLRRIPFERQVIIPIRYKGREVGKGRLDILVADALIIELKSVEALSQVHTAQLLSYLRATHYTLGLLINFNAVVLRNSIRRLVLTR